MQLILAGYEYLLYLRRMWRILTEYENAMGMLVNKKNFEGISRLGSLMKKLIHTLVELKILISSNGSLEEGMLLCTNSNTGNSFLGTIWNNCIQENMYVNYNKRTHCHLEEPHEISL